MRIKTKPMPKHLELRTIKVFLWFPRKIQNEWRWLEVAEITQEYHRIRYDWGWKDWRWKD